MSEYMQENQTTIYDETAQRIENAYRAFRSVYVVQFPPPKEPSYPARPIVEAAPVPSAKPTEKAFSFIGAKQAGFLIALIGAVIVSASHTVPVFLGIRDVSEINFGSTEFIIAAAVFVMIEMALITFAYSSTEGNANVDSAKSVYDFTRGGTWFIVTIMALGNVYYVLSYRTAIAQIESIAWAWETARVIIFLLIGLSAPIVALITGEILAIDVLKHRAKQRRELQLWEEKTERDFQHWELKTNHEQGAWQTKVDNLENQYKQALADWNIQINGAWAKVKAQWGGTANIMVTKPETPVLPLSTLSNRQQTDRQGYERLSNATDKAYEWFVSNPDSLDKTVRELAEIIGVGKDSVAKAKKRYSEYHGDETQ